MQTARIGMLLLLTIALFSIAGVPADGEEGMRENHWHTYSISRTTSPP